MASIKEPKVLIYDIETTPVLAWIWRCGKQFVRHGQLHEDYNVTRVICITYRWMHQKKAKALVFDIETMDDSQVIEDFDKLLDEADIVIGKNNKRFDDKHINFRRFMNNLPPLPDWATKSDDLESQMRRNFNMQSFALDYFSELMGHGGKIKMELDDWIQIVQHKNKSRLRKMVKYGKKDADDTVELVNKVWPYIKPRYNYAAHYGNDKPRCRSCGSDHVHRNGTKIIGNVRKQRWNCSSCGGYCGTTALLKNGKDGKML